MASLEDFEIRMNQAIERNVYLESELDEKEALKAAVQRLKDETKDLRSELKILAPDNDKAAAAKNVAVTTREQNHHHQHPSSADSNRQESFGEDVNDNSGPTTPSKSGDDAHGGGGNPPPPLTPSARISALNIVGDLLRKVGALELKLVSCRNIVKENQHNKTNGTSGGSGGSTQDILNRMPRVASTPRR